MQIVSFEAQRRSETGATANRRFRNQGLIPSVVYSHNEKTIPLLISAKDFTRLAKQSRSSQVFTLNSTDTEINGKTVIVKDIQKHGIKGYLMHVDFQALKENEEITVRVPLVLTGEPIGVKLNGGILTAFFHDLAVRCLPRMIPDEIVLDISTLDVNDSYHASDVKMPDGVKLVDDAHETIVSVAVPKAEEEKSAETAAPAEGEAAAAGAAAAGTEGAAAAPAAAGAAKGAAPAAKK